MMRMTSVLGLLLGLTTQAYALPTIDCADGGFLVDADLGLIAIDDEVVAIAREVQRFPGAVSPEDFCAGQGDLVAFILPVPKISPGAPPVDPDLPDPGVQRVAFGGRHKDRPALDLDLNAARFERLDHLAGGTGFEPRVEQGHGRLRRDPSEAEHRGEDRQRRADHDDSFSQIQARPDRIELLHDVLLE